MGLKSIKKPSNEDWYVEKYATGNPDIGWNEVGDLHEEEKCSLLYYLLTNLEGWSEQNTLDEIINNEPSLLNFYRENLISDFESIDEIAKNMPSRNWWKLARNATKDEVDVILNQIDFTTKNSILLLFGADTDYALKKLATNEKHAKLIATIGQDLNVFKNMSGTFERKYISKMDHLFAEEEEGTQSIPEGITLLEAGSRVLQKVKLPCCDNDLKVVLSVNLSVLDAFRGTALESLGIYHFFTSNCEGCDAWIAENDFWIIDGEPWILRGCSDDENCNCDPEDAEPMDEDLKRKFLLISGGAVSKSGFNRIAQLGGRPDWVQSAEMPNCFKCREMMTFVGQTSPSDWSGKVNDHVIFGFACPSCATATQLMQCT